MRTISTFLQIDLQNLFFGAKNRGKKIDLEKILGHFNSRDSEFLTEAVVYTIKGEDGGNDKFEAKLKEIGYTVTSKSSKKIVKNDKIFYRHINNDVKITIDCMNKLDSFNKWIFMSGDGDFLDLCKFLKGAGKQIELWSFKESYNSVLEPFADKIYFIEENFFYKPPIVNVFGFKLDI